MLFYKSNPVLDKLQICYSEISKNYLKQQHFAVKFEKERGKQDGSQADLCR